MNKTKRNITIAAVLLCICAAVYLDWSYNNRNGDEAMANAELANAKANEEAAASGEDSFVSDYFAEARLTRQQSRDEALELLQSAAESDTASQETIDSAMSSIAAMASYSMQETQIENLIIAKNFAECVAFMSADGITIAVPAPADGLASEDVAKITDAIIAETGLDATKIKIIEIKKPGAEASPTVSPAASPCPTAETKTDTPKAETGNLDENWE